MNGRKEFPAFYRGLFVALVETMFYYLCLALPHSIVDIVRPHTYPYGRVHTRASRSILL